MFYESYYIKYHTRRPLSLHYDFKTFYDQEFPKTKGLEKGIFEYGKIPFSSQNPEKDATQSCTDNRVILKNFYGI